MGDGIPDWWKVTYGFSLTDPAVASEPSTNPWAHGLSNLQVYQNPSVLIADDYSTLGDGIPDWWKVTYNFSLTDPNVAGADPDGDGWSNLEEYLNNTNPLYNEGTLDFIVNGGQAYSPSLTLTIQPQSTNYPSVLLSLDSSMSNATVLAISGGTVLSTLPDDGDGGYELFLQYADAQGQPHGPTLSKNVVVDRTPPVVYITSPASTAILNQAFITLQAVAADPNPVVPDAARPLNIWINGQPFWDREGTNIVVSLFPVPLGSNSLTVSIQVEDQAGNTNQATQTWVVDTSTATNAPTLLSANIPSTMLLPDVDSIWVEGDIDNGNALVSALVASDSGDMTTNSLNVWKQHYEGLVPLSSGTNQVVLLASDAAGNSSSMFFTIVRSTRFQAAITSPAFGDFATAPSNTVSGYVSAVFDAGLPTQTNVVGVTINGVAATLHWDQVDENGNVPFTTTNAIPLGESITGYLVGDGIPTDPPPSIPPAMSQVYEVTHKVEVNDDIRVPDIVPEITQEGSLYNPTNNPYFWDAVWWTMTPPACWHPMFERDITSVTEDFIEATSQVQSNCTQMSGNPPNCLTTFDPDEIAWNMGGPSVTSSTVDGPIDRGLSFGTYEYDHGEAVYSETYSVPGPNSSPCEVFNILRRYRTLWRSLDIGSLRFRAPRQYRQYGTNTTVIFTLEGVDYRRRDGAALDLSQVRFRGQSPIAYSNEAQTVSYWLTVNGGQEYTINQDDFQWPADQQLHHEASASEWPWWPPCAPTTESFVGSWVEDMHWLTWTNFHNLYAWVVGPTNVLYLCSQQQQTNILLTAHASTGTGEPYTAGTYTWSVTAGTDLVQMTSSNNVATITPRAPSINAGDVQITMMFTTPYNLSYTVTNNLTVLTPGGVQLVSQAPGDLGSGYGFTNSCVYQVVNQLPDHGPLRMRINVHEDFPTPAPSPCTMQTGDKPTDGNGRVYDKFQVDSYCLEKLPFDMIQRLTVDCISQCHTAQCTDSGINVLGFGSCP